MPKLIIKEIFKKISYKEIVVFKDYFEFGIFYHIFPFPFDTLRQAQ